MRLLFVVIVMAFIAALAWIFWKPFVFLMIISSTTAVSMFCLFCLTEFARSCFVKFEGWNFCWLGVVLGIVWFAIVYTCNVVPVAIGSTLGFMAYVYGTWGPEKPVHPHEFQ